MKAALRSLADRFGPDWVREWRTVRWLTREAIAVRTNLANARTAADAVDAVFASSAFRPQQIRSEIVGLLGILCQDPPRRVMEIGGRRGGTLALFAYASAADARLLSIDLGYGAAQIRANALLARERQSIACLSADSHSEDTLARARLWLAGQADLLFIDGDHSLHGVGRDFEMYSTLVRHGGIIAVHDIIPDARTRRGTPSASDSGEVPVFWDDLSRSALPSTELVEDREQDGFGIGVVRWPGPA